MGPVIATGVDWTLHHRSSTMLTPEGEAGRHLGELAKAVQGVDVGAADALVVKSHQRLVVELDAQHRRLRRLGHVRLVRVQRQRVALRGCWRYCQSQTIMLSKQAAA